MRKWVLIDTGYLVESVKILPSNFTRKDAIEYMVNEWNLKSETDKDSYRDGCSGATFAVCTAEIEDDDVNWETLADDIDISRTDCEREKEWNVNLWTASCCFVD